jgi:formylglycine-generating enzyme required for sulfatase activity
LSAPWAAAAALLLVGAACSDDKSCASDASVSDASTVNCKKDKVTCKSGEINAYGVCLAESGMVKVPAGDFTMGKTDTGKDYSPEHKVTLKEFLIDKAEVTVAQYQACVDCAACAKPLRTGSHTGREPYYGNTKYAGYPVIFVSHKDAKKYCEGIGKRLPTEAEWEKAARGTQKNTYPWGNTDPSKTIANFGGYVNDTDDGSKYDGGKSPYGALNMAGNVWEWVADTYDKGYYAKSPGSDPAGPAAGPQKVARGGGFISNPAQITTYYRAVFDETAQLSLVGFRCAKDKW